MTTPPAARPRWLPGGAGSQLRTTLALAVAAVLVALVLGACHELSDGPLARRLGVENDTTTAVEVFVVLSDAERLVAEIRPNRTAWFDALRWRDAPDGGYCTVSDLIVRTTDGREIARIPPPVCTGESRAVSDYLLPAPS